MRNEILYDLISRAFARAATQECPAVRSEELGYLGSRLLAMRSRAEERQRAITMETLQVRKDMAAAAPLAKHERLFLANRRMGRVQEHQSVNEALRMTARLCFDTKALLPG